MKKTTRYRRWKRHRDDDLAVLESLKEMEKMRKNIARRRRRKSNEVYASNS